MSNLRSNLIRLAHTNPELRPALLPILRDTPTRRASSGVLKNILNELLKLQKDPGTKDIRKGLSAIQDLAEEIQGYADGQGID